MGSESVIVGRRRERMLGSPRYSKGRFRNVSPGKVVAHAEERPRSMLSTTAEYFFGGTTMRRPPAPFPTESPLAAWRETAASGLRVTWLGHSTTLIEIDGFRILTDPVWSDRISPVSVVGPRRFQAAPVTIAELPPLDAVVVSHDHYDHLDFPSVRALARRDVPFYTSLGVGARLEGLGIDPSRITELDWWEDASLFRDESALTFTATPAHHFSGRSPFDRNRTLWSSFVLATDRHRVFFSGDTGLTDEFATIREQQGPFDLVMLEVGAFHPAWGDIHLGPENALVAHEMLGGGALLPVHWGTFDLALHAWDDPIETLARRAEDRHIVTPRLGQPIEPAHVERIDPWWRSVQRLPAIAPGAALRT